MNYFNQYHPLIIFIYYIGALILVMTMLHPYFIIMAFCLIVTVHFVTDKFKTLKQWLFIMVTTGIFMIIVNPLFNERGRVLVLEVFDHRVTLEALLSGGMAALSLVCVIALFVSYHEVMTPNKLFFLFSKFLPQFAVLFMLTMRFIPLMRRRIVEISAIQESKGISVKNGQLKEKIKAGFFYIQLLVTFSLEEAIQTADSMKARGYGHGKRSSYDYFRFKRQDAYAVIYLIILFCVVLIGRNSGYGQLTIYPMMEQLELTIVELYVIAFYSMFLSFPLVKEAWGRLQWRIFN
jgi:energy-coupling factor transport system permease protein